VALRGSALMKVLADLPVDSEIPTLAHCDPTTQALFEEARRLRRRRNRRWAVLAVSVGLAVAVTIVTLVHTVHSAGPTLSVGHEDSATRTPTAAVPAEIVVWKEFRIELISSKTGRLIRTLATDVGLNRGTPHPTVSPSGTVYFDDANDVTITAPSEQILSVPLLGGPATHVADGRHPVVSPNGRFLAYVTYVDYTNGREGIAVRDLLTGAMKTWRYANTGPDISALSWSPDSESLSFSAITPTPDNRTETLGTWALGVSSSPGSLDAARKIPLPPGMAWAGYLKPDEGIAVFQHPGLTGQMTSIELRVVDAGTGRIIARLPSVRGLLGVDNSLDGSEGTIQIDPSGQHLALVEVGSGEGTLYRWTIGSVPNHISAGPIQITTGVFGAAWVPAR